jgi:hypothetical protein
MPKASRGAHAFSAQNRSPIRDLRPGLPDLETHIQEDLTGEIDALAAALFDLLKHRRDIAEAEITEDMVQRLREMMFFAAMNGADEILAMAGGTRRH